MTRTAIALLLCACLACESSRTIPTRTMPHGEEIACVGIAEKHKQAGIDYDLSVRNAALGIVGVELVVPPIIVLAHETYCPVADTSTVRGRR